MQGKMSESLFGDEMTHIIYSLLLCRIGTYILGTNRMHSRPQGYTFEKGRGSFLFLFCIQINCDPSLSQSLKTDLLSI